MSVSFIVLLLLTGLLNVKGQRYDSCSELRDCEQKIDNLISSSSRLPSYQCRELLQNINCMLKSISCVREDGRQNYGTKIRRARDQHKISCESDEWTKKNYCFDSSEMQSCESRFPRRAISQSVENCRSYDQYHDCVRNAISKLCRGDESDHIPMYLLDMAHDLSWQCPQYSSSYPSSSSPSWPSSGRGPYNNNTDRFNEEICCGNERCDNSRRYQCREDLRKISEGGDGYSRDSYSRDATQCRSYLNKFNCFLWQSYHCASKYEKNADVLRRGKEAIERRCDVRGDIQRTQCFLSKDIRDCERHPDDRRSSSRQDCREYKDFYDCVERYVRRSCNRNDELLLGYYLISKSSENAFTCSYSDGYQTQHPYNPSDTTYSDDDSACETVTRSNYRDCERRMEEYEEEIRKITNSQERHTRSCCSALTYRECIRQVVRKHCRRENSAVVDLLMGSSIRYRIQSCEDINYSTCSGTRTLSNILFMAIALIFSRIYFQ